MRRIREYWVNDERMVLVIARDVKTDRVALESIAAGNLRSGTVQFLIDHGSVLANLLAAGREYELPIRIQPNFLHTVEGQRDVSRIRPWVDDKVVLELTLVAAIHQIDARIDVLVLDLLIVDDVSAPLLRIIAEQVVTSGGKFVFAVGGWSGIGAQQLHAHSQGGRRGG